VDDIRIGLVCRALRRRAGWRQADLAKRAGVSQDQISRIERGLLGGIPYHTVRNVFAALGARFDGVVAWRGGEIDRLLDERHASLVGQAAAVYRANGWEAIPEVTFQRYGDRGSIDLLGLHPPTRSASINEMKSDILSVEETHRRHDVKVRLAASIVEERFGWRPKAIGRILVVPEETRIRRAVGRHAAVFGAVYPASSREVRSWIRQPSGSLAGIWFLSPTRPARDRRAPGGPKRVRVPRTRTGRSPVKA
jgi:transcriptional regulator with XRE-family HTH domain